LSDLQAADGFAAGEVTAVVAHVPPLVARLVGRPLVADPASNYAKLCLPFVAGVFLARGRCDVPDFRDEALRDPAVHRHAAKVRVVQDANPDENALDPQTIEVTFASGASRAITLPHVYGHPEAPLTEAENEAKFRRCLSYAVPAISPARGDRILALVRDLEAAPDVSALVEAMAG
jgi:2-methylcitrate dehydratase PrpD